MAAKSQTPLHPACEPLAKLLGLWRGQGRGSYPTVEPFTYLEEVSFAHVGKPFLVYSQKTFNPATKQPMHSEFGYWRPTGNGSLEVVLIHPTGVTEVTEGSFQTVEAGAKSEQADAGSQPGSFQQADSGSQPGSFHQADSGSQPEQVETTANDPRQELMIQLDSTSIGLTGTAKEVTQLNRVFKLDLESGLTAAKLSYRLEMAAVGQPLQFHLMAELEQQAG